MNAEEIKTTRLALGLTQVELGKALDVTGNAVALWERGERTPEAPAMLGAALDHLLVQKALGGELGKRLKKLQKIKAELEVLVNEPLLAFAPPESERPRVRK